MIPDFYGELASNGTRAVWLNNGAGNFSLITQSSTTPLANPGSHAFVDLDGDCLADLAIVSNDGEGGSRLEMWLNQGGSYVLHSTLSLPLGAGPLSFVDINGDGTSDVVCGVCEGGDCSNTTIHVWSNKQLPLCGYFSNGGCRDAENLCTSDPNFAMQSPVIVTNSQLQGFQFPSSAPSLSSPSYHPMALRFGMCTLALEF
eukprot:Colp12_sorted_trinity150504_noHs@24654